jgi:hypothetical protein
MSRKGTLPDFTQCGYSTRLRVESHESCGTGIAKAQTSLHTDARVPALRARLWGGVAMPPELPVGRTGLVVSASSQTSWWPRDDKRCQPLGVGDPGMSGTLEIPVRQERRISDQHHTATAPPRLGGKRLTKTREERLPLLVFKLQGMGVACMSPCALGVRCCPIPQRSGSYLGARKQRRCLEPAPVIRTACRYGDAAADHPVFESTHASAGQRPAGREHDPMRTALQVG